jgi:hypothetical protein
MNKTSHNNSSMPLGLSRGITLMEVLAAMFVICIGLMGVLAVIPFGMFQVGKARNAEYISNMLANAKQEIQFNGMAKPSNWIFPPGSATTLNCTKIVMFNPFGASPPDAVQMAPVLPPFQQHFQNAMTGNDDIQYETNDNGDRSKYFPTKDENGKPVSSGQYTWFFTYRPVKKSGSTEPDNAVLPSDLEPVTVDLLGCYNRISDEDRQASAAFVSSLQGGTLTLNGFAEWDLFRDTKYVFVIWNGTPAPNGIWCKVLYVNKNANSLVVSGELSAAPASVNVYIPSGVLYHTRVDNIDLQ